MGKPWTPEEDVILKQMADAGALIEDVMPVFHYRTKRGIQDHAREIGHPLTGPKNEIDMEAFQAFLNKEKGVKPSKQPV